MEGICMLKNFATWVLISLASSLLAMAGGLDDGKAFVWLYVLVDFTNIVIFGKAILRVAEKQKDVTLLREASDNINGILVSLIIAQAIIKVSITSLVSLMFNLNFCSAYRIFELINCLKREKRQMFMA